MAVDWFKCKGGVWCNLFKLDLNHQYLEDINGIFIVWTGVDTISVLQVGSGNIQKELIKIKNDIAMKAFSHLGLYVSWAEVSSIKRSGMELYMIRELNPKMQRTEPNAIPLKVNLPWEA